MKTAAIYTRVSSEQQKENKTIESQVGTLINFAKEKGYILPEEYIFRDEGYSGAILVRPGLERIRDLSAEGQIQSVLVYSPDRLSRNYAYQVVLMDELHANGTEVLFVNSPKAETPEEALLLQFQAMIAEYERAMIKERSRRGKRHKARSGIINVLGGAPFGYNYIRKTQLTNASYEINPQEASVVQRIYRLYTEEMKSIGEITKDLNKDKIPTRKGVSRWERSTVWAILRNPAYIGKAYFGKTQRTERTRITKPLREKGGYTNKNNANKETPRDQWIEIPVPPIITAETFELAGERLAHNKIQSKRNTIEQTLLQGMMVCGQCGYSLYRTSTKTSKRKLYYYRCLGSDNYRFEKGRKCDCRPVRQEYVDELVWQSVVELLRKPTLIQKEIDKRISETKKADPMLNQKAFLEKQKAKSMKAMDKLLDAYQEGLIPLDQLRKRMKKKKKRVNETIKQVQNIQNHEITLGKQLELLDIKAFTKLMEHNLENLDILDKRKIIKLLVKEIFVDHETIHIRHSIPVREVKHDGEKKSYKLCTWSIESIAIQYIAGSTGQVPQG
ncbi:MAG: recombinase family protein [Cytophagales bacterium]|nr:recombinase family protein [Cytophagales bacterium]